MIRTNNPYLKKVIYLILHTSLMHWFLTNEEVNFAEIRDAYVITIMINN